MKYKVLAAAIAALSSNAYALSGKIVDEQGSAIANAQIQVDGKKESYVTTENGQFEIPEESVDELHIKADGFSHKIIHLHHKHDDELNITLSKSVLEVVDVIGIPIHASKIESAQPISVLAGDSLRKNQAASLGDTLDREVGVHSSSYGGVTSSPIIRGLGGPRVQISQNGLDVSDASRVGPDHNVSVEAMTAHQIEILRGPATLFYGSGAIGGVVNVVDDRVPQDSEQKSAFMSEYNTVNEETVFSGAYTGGNETIAFHVDGFWRDSDDYEIPGLAEFETEEEHEEEGHEEHEGGILENSASESTGFNLGTSWLLDNGYVGISYGYLDKQNGIPGHGHGEEEHDEALEMEEEEHAEEQVISDLTQDRFQLISEFQLEHDFFTSINSRIGYTDYEHAEIHMEEHAEIGEEEEEHEEHGEGTVFKSSTVQARVDLAHAEVAGWKGAFSIETKNNDFEAIGEEAFTPPSKTNAFAISLLEEKHVGDFLWQIGARIERVSLSADDIHLGHEHEEEHEGEELAEEEHEHEESLVEFEDLDFTPFSLSAGIVWDFKPGYNVGLSISHAERAPNAAEIFSAGPHIATNAFEAGALFEIHEEDGELHLEYEGEASEETSNNIDLTFRKFEGNFGFVVNLFHNEVSDHYSLVNTGLTTEDIFEEEAAELEEEEHEHGADLPVYIFEQADATFSGLELEFAWQINQYVKWTVWGDHVHAELDSGDYLPRISPNRLANQLNFGYKQWSAELSAINYFDQNKVAQNETPTDGYTIVDARVTYALQFADTETHFYLAANNLTDEEARVHTSFLKNQAPLPGRNFKLGLYTRF